MSGDREVPCAGCIACCRGGELIVLHPEDGDDRRRYLTRRARNPLTGQMVDVLRQTAAGDCVYLGESGCKIYDRRPAICRSFDCRRMLDMLASALGPAQLVQAVARSELLQAAAQRRAAFPLAGAGSRRVAPALPPSPPNAPRGRALSGRAPACSLTPKETLHA